MYPTVRVDQPNRSALYIMVCEPLVVGRECDGLLLADDKVSRQHLRLSPTDGGVGVADLGSTNGTYVGDRRVESAVLLMPGMAARLGETLITVLEPPQGPPSTRSGPPIETDNDPTATVVSTLPQADTPPFEATELRPEPSGQSGPPGPPPAPPPPVPAPPTPPAPPHPAGLGASAAVVKPAPAGPASRRTSIDAMADSLANDQINLPSGSADDTVTIMFSDIESSTDLALSMGDEAWYRALTWHNQLIESRVTDHGGFIVKHQGDGFMITFNSARRAIMCATEIQQDLAANQSEHPVKVRIGLHTGEAIRQDSGDLFGRHVIIAARIGSVARGGEILVSSIVREITSARGDLQFGQGGATELKGVGVQHVYPVVWA